MAEAPQLLVYSYNTTTDEAIAESDSTMENDKKQEEETYAHHHLSASPSSDGNGLRPRIKYGEEELLNLQFAVRREEQLRRWNGIMAALGPVGCDLCAMEKSGQVNKDNRRQRGRKKKEQVNKAEIISTGSVLLLKSEEECYEELPCSGLSGLKAAEFQKSSNCLFEENRDFESSEDEFDSLLKPALAVEGEPDFASGSPQDGFEYLRRVRNSWGDIF